jgi:DegV family protein with EDD domain
LPPEVAREHDITVIPLQIQIDGETFEDGVDLSHDEFYRRLAAGALPTTSQPTPAKFMEAYRRLFEVAESIISVHIMATASGTLQSARMAADMLPDKDISTVDSLTTSWGLGFLAVAAAQMAKLGRTRDEILDFLNRAKKKINIHVVIPDLTLQRRSGRVNLGQAMMAGLLSIKPIVHFTEGKMPVVDKVRSLSRAVDRMIELAAETVGTNRVKVGVLHANAPDQAQTILERVKTRFNTVEAFIAEMGSTIASHGGQGTLAVATYQVD